MQVVVRMGPHVPPELVSLGFAYLALAVVLRRPAAETRRLEEALMAGLVNLAAIATALRGVPVGGNAGTCQNRVQRCADRHQCS